MDLGTETDRLNEAFEQLEGALTSLDFGVSASVELDTQTKLSFRKSGDGWKLMIDRNDSQGPIELLMASRLTRILASEKVDELFQCLLTEKNRKLSEVSNAVVKVNTVTSKVVAYARNK